MMLETEKLKESINARIESLYEKEQRVVNPALVKARISMLKEVLRMIKNQEDETRKISLKDPRLVSLDEPAAFHSLKEGQNLILSLDDARIEEATFMWKTEKGGIEIILKKDQTLLAVSRQALYKVYIYAD